MIEKWKMSLKEFLKTYEEDDEVTGAILVGSYATGNENSNSGIDVYLVLKDYATYNKSGVIESNSYLINYYINTKDHIKNIMESEFNNNKMNTVNMLAYGKIIYDLEGTVKELQDKALEYVDKPFKTITVKKLDQNNYYIWNMLDKLKNILDENGKEFNTIYYSLLGEIYNICAETFEVPKLPLSKTYKLLTDQKYRENYHLYKIADDDFIKLYLKCYEEERHSIMYKNICKLVEYYYQKCGGFNVRTYEIENKLGDE